MKSTFQIIFKINDRVKPPVLHPFSSFGQKPITLFLFVLRLPGQENGIYRQNPAMTTQRLLWRLLWTTHDHPEETLSSDHHLIWGH
jgi:hypothetical protein